MSSGDFSNPIHGTEDAHEFVNRISKQENKTTNIATQTYNLNEIVIIKQNWKFNLLYRIAKSYASHTLLSKIKYDRNNEFNNLITLFLLNRR